MKMACASRLDDGTSTHSSLGLGASLWKLKGDWNFKN